MYTRPAFRELDPTSEQSGCCWVLINGTAVQVPEACNNGNFPTCDPSLPTSTACVIGVNTPFVSLIVCGYASLAQCIRG